MNGQEFREFSMTDRSNYHQILAELELIANREEFERLAVHDRHFANEVICTLFDDLKIEKLLLPTTILPEPEIRLLESFVALANAAVDEMSTHIEGSQLVINDHWRQAQQIARELLNAHQRGRN